MEDALQMSSAWSHTLLANTGTVNARHSFSQPPLLSDARAPDQGAANSHTHSRLSIRVLERQIGEGRWSSTGVSAAQSCGVPEKGAGQQFGAVVGVFLQVSSDLQCCEYTVYFLK